MTKKRNIKPLAPRTCPQCGGEGTFEINADKVECGVCGYVVRGGDGRPTKQKKQPAPHPVGTLHTRKRDLSKIRASYFISNRDEIPGYVEAAFFSAMDAVHRQDWDEAKRNLLRCIDFERDFVDAHLWMARLSEDVEVIRDHITSILAVEPAHAEALHELMILNGEIDPDIAYDVHTTAQQMETDGAVVGQTTNVKCPQCGSPNMSDDEASGTLYCESCGHRMEKKQRSDTGMRSFNKAMIKRRFTGTEWKIGKRLIQCNSCGAKRTLSKSQLTQTCPFCGSRHIIKTDALGTFEQPDAIIPFSVKQDEAMRKLDEKLNSRVEKLKGWFIDNRVERKEIEGVFLPFWMFDAVVEVTRTTIEDRSNDYQPVVMGSYLTEKIPEMMNNVPVPGVKSPPRHMLDQIGRYDLKRAVKYTPELIAQHSAEIYAVEFDKAAMDMHEIVGKAMRREYADRRRQEEKQINVFSMIKNMTFTLALLPVWSITIFEKDGDVRPALVNGQTGRVVLGKAKKPD